MSGEGSWWVGIGLGILANVLAAGAVALVAVLGLDQAAAALLFPGVVQLVFVIPLVIGFWIRGDKRTVWGLCLTAGTVFLLNGACWGIVGVGLSQM